MCVAVVAWGTLVGRTLQRLAWHRRERLSLDDAATMEITFRVTAKTKTRTHAHTNHTQTHAGKKHTLGTALHARMPDWPNTLGRLHLSSGT